MIGLGIAIVVTAIIWIMTFLLHELCHILEAMRQGASEGVIRVWKFGPIPSFVAEPGEIKNKFMFGLSGGLYSGIAVGILAVIANMFHYTPFDYAFTALSATNIIYSFFEARYLFRMERSKYMIIHYLIYIAVMAIVTAFYWRRLVGWL